MRRESVDECVRSNLELLREVTRERLRLRCALIGPEEPASRTCRSRAARFAQCRPEALRGASSGALPLVEADGSNICGSRSCAIRARRGLSRRPKRERFAELQHRLGAARHVSRAGQARRLPRRSRAHAAARRLGCEPAAADEAHRHEPRAPALSGMRIEARLAKLEERTHSVAGRRQRWPVGLRRREQRGLFFAALEGDARLRR